MTTIPATPRISGRRIPDSGRPRWEERPTPAGQTGKTGVILLVLAVVLVPIYSVVLTSLSGQAAINEAGGMVLVPHGITFDAYRQIFSNQTIIHALAVSTGVTVVGTLISMAASVMCAYGLSRRGSFGHRTILMLLIITMFFHGGLVPTFLVVTKLGGYNQYWSLILPSAISVFNILVLRGFFSATAQDLIDAARIDGAGHWRVLWSVVMPTSRAVVAVTTLFYAVGYWNNFFSGFLYMNSERWPLPNVINSYVLQGNPVPGTGITTTGQYAGHQPVANLTIQMAVVVLSLVPVLLISPFMQRHFAKGMLLGAIKG